jgi:hypothetical protein
MAPIFGFLFLSVFVPSLRAADDRKVAVPFDFVSTFDNGRYGQIMGDMVWKKLSRDGKFIVPESMLDVREFCAGHHIQPSPETELAQMRKIVQNDFGAQVGIWGSIERAPGEESEIYDLTIKCVDFSTQPNPKTIYQVKARTQAVGEIPHVYVKQMLDALYGRPPAGPEAPDPAAEANWKSQPNLVVGDFERATDGVPKGWDKVCGQQREPLGRLVRWAAEKDNASNHVIRLMPDQATAEFEGVMYYSEFFPVEEGAKYRFQCRFRSNGPAVKVFIKCYDDVASRYRASSEGAAKSSASGRKPAKDARWPEVAQRREVYRSQQPLSDGALDTWTWKTHTQDFTPKHTKYSPKWGRVMLYAYTKAGTVEFDDVVVKQIVPPPSGQPEKVLRHSTDSKITIKEMQENERRSRQRKAELRIKTDQRTDGPKEQQQQ